MANIKDTRSIFDKTMSACLNEGKVARKASTKKAIKESSRKATRRVSERRKRFYEEDEVDDDDAEMPGDIDADVAVLVDPELDTEDLVDVVDELQDIVDATPDDLAPYVDDYIGDITYQCPACGNTIVSDVELEPGDECPVCGNVPEKFIIAGVIEEPGESDEGAAAELDPAEIDMDYDELPEDSEEAEDDELIVDAEADADEEVEEGAKIRKRQVSGKGKHCRSCDAKKARMAGKKAPRKEARKPRFSKLTIDEATFSAFLSKFVKENYKNAKSMKVVKASMKGKMFKLECSLTFKSGKSKKVTLVSESFKPAKKMVMKFHEAKGTNVFKNESKHSRATKTPFMFEAVITPKLVIKCEGLRYNIVSRKSKRECVQVSGRLIKESRKPVKRTKRR